MARFLFVYIFFFFNDTATTEIYTLSLHDALPICGHEVVALHVIGDLLERLPAVLGDDLLHAPLERDRLAGVDLDVACLPLEAAPELVDEDLRVRERHPLPALAGGKQQRSQRH